MEFPLTQQDIVNRLSCEKYSEYLENTAYVHSLTKHYLLIAEELAPDGNVFLQPLKEHRDAYDHIFRIFGLSLREKGELPKSIDDYMLDNLKKAFGHEYRAFFDAADWLTFICRRYIRESLSVQEIRDRYTSMFDFDSTKSFINNVSFVIAEYRKTKDVSSNKVPLLTEVDKYKEVLDQLLEIYRNVQKVEY